MLAFLRTAFVWFIVPVLLWALLVAAALAEPIVVDDPQATVTAGSLEDVTWETSGNYGGTWKYYGYSGDPDGSAALTYTFSVTPGTYKVYATWPDTGYNAIGGRISFGPVTHDYAGATQPEADLTLGGRPFQELGQVTITGSSLVVTCSSVSAYTFGADAIAIEAAGGSNPPPGGTTPPTNVTLWDVSAGDFDYSSFETPPTSGVAYQGDVYVNTAEGGSLQWHIDDTDGLTPGKYRLYVSMPQPPPAGETMALQLHYPLAIASGAQQGVSVSATYPVRATAGVEWGGANWELFADNINISDLIQYITVQMSSSAPPGYVQIDAFALERVGDATTGETVPGLWFYGASSSNMVDETGGGTPGGDDGEYTYIPPGAPTWPYQNAPPNPDGTDPNDQGVSPCNCNCDVPPPWPHGEPAYFWDGQWGVMDTEQFNGCSEFAYPIVAAGGVHIGSHWSYGVDDLGNTSLWRAFPKPVPAGVQVRAVLAGFRVTSPSQYEFNFWVRLDGNLLGDTAEYLAEWPALGGGQTFIGSCVVKVGRNGHIQWAWSPERDGEFGGGGLGPLYFAPEILQSILENPNGLYISMGDVTTIQPASAIFSETEEAKLLFLLTQLQASLETWTDWRSIIGRTADQDFDGEGGTGDTGTGTPGTNISVPEMELSPWSPNGKELKEENLPAWVQPEHWSRVFGSHDFPTIGTQQLDMVIWDDFLGMGQIGIKTSELWTDPKWGPTAVALRDGMRTVLLLGLGLACLGYVLMRLRGV